MFYICNNGWVGGVFVWIILILYIGGCLYNYIKNCSIVVLEKKSYSCIVVVFDIIIRF